MNVREREVAKQGRSLSGIGPSYAEDVTNVASLYKLIKPSMVNQEESVQLILSETFHKPVEIINEYLLHSEYFEDYILDDLSKSGINKKVFEEIQKIIGRIKIDCRHDGLSEPEITTHVSKAVTEMLSEYSETGRIDFSVWKTDWKELTQCQNGKIKSRRRKTKRKKQRAFEYHPGAKNPPEDLPVTIDETNKALEGIRRRLNDLSDLNDDNLKPMARKLKKEMIELAKVHNNTSDLIQNQNLNTKKDT